MFRKLIESANTIIQKLDKQGSAHLSTVPEEERVKWSELIGWETAAKSVIVRTFGTDSHQMKKWEGVLDFFAELNEIQRAESTYEPVQFNSQRMGQLLDLLIEFQT